MELRRIPVHSSLHRANLVMGAERELALGSALAALLVGIGGMSLVSAVYAKGANILTINQNIPVNGRALISISARVDHLDSSVEELLEQLRQVEGVLSIDSISDE